MDKIALELKQQFSDFLLKNISKKYGKDSLQKAIKSSVINFIISFVIMTVITLFLSMRFGTDSDNLSNYPVTMLCIFGFVFLLGLVFKDSQIFFVTINASIFYMCYIIVRIAIFSGFSKDNLSVLLLSVSIMLLFIYFSILQIIRLYNASLEEDFNTLLELEDTDDEKKQIVYDSIRIIRKKQNILSSAKKYISVVVIPVYATVLFAFLYLKF
ncbi:MAG: hypothetical protein SOZ27_08480 [Spirochaetia bacterium]|nr:hypothetical protein [Spirochaetia bacterium]